MLARYSRTPVKTGVIFSAFATGLSAPRHRAATPASSLQSIPRHYLPRREDPATSLLVKLLQMTQPTEPAAPLILCPSPQRRLLSRAVRLDSTRLNSGHHFSNTARPSVINLGPTNSMYCSSIRISSSLLLYQLLFRRHGTLSSLSVASQNF